MPTSYRIDAGCRTIYSSAKGAVTDADLLEHQARLRGDPEFDRSFDQIWDLREVAEAKVTIATLRKLAQARSFDPGARRALVAPRDVDFGLARMFQTLHGAAPEEVRVFRTMAEAREWLGDETA